MTSSPSSHTDASLLGRLGRSPDDAAAWNEFVHRYGRKLLQWCRYWKLQEADAQDVTQNILLKVTRQMHTFRYDPGRSFRAWLKTIAHAAWCDWLEGQKRPGRGSGDTSVLELLGTVEARDDLVRQFEEEYNRELLEAATVQVRLRVEPHVWEAFQLMVYEGMSGAEVATRLSMKVGSVFVAKSRVQKMLQEVIREFEAGVEKPA